jgi:hypothetical protein
MQQLMGQEVARYPDPAAHIPAEDSGIEVKPVRGERSRSQSFSICFGIA